MASSTPAKNKLSALNTSPLLKGLQSPVSLQVLPWSDRGQEEEENATSICEHTGTCRGLEKNYPSWTGSWAAWTHTPCSGKEPRSLSSPWLPQISILHHIRTKALRLPFFLDSHTPLSLQHQLPAYGSVADYLRKTPSNITITYHKSLVFQ